VLPVSQRQPAKRELEPAKSETGATSVLRRARSGGAGSLAGFAIRKALPSGFGGWQAANESFVGESAWTWAFRRENQDGDKEHERGRKEFQARCREVLRLRGEF